ncbi:CPBP family intramembrane glutamic endopeptidase [Streptococcus zalophi]|uniref:CPBP family intramembrane metalloprotease n=1 Tax=Streptococcus zalophi TaxID=640031 RepID=A0A934P9N3_9STRE|nr:type II CAAX endopeptidase family protein [Streptococcus zalophi]MBJ8349721.1 CPBP family intramembrane metalloprotease [Streptococcus zalophi]
MARVGYFFIGLLGPLFFWAILYMFHFDNQAINDVVQVVVEIILLWLSFRYFQKSEIDKFRFPTKKQWLIFLVSLVTIFIFSSVYSYFFDIYSGAETALKESYLENGYSLSLVSSLVFLAPLQEELLMRGFIQKGAFKNNWIGVLLAASIFAGFHYPENLVSFVHYAIAGLIFGYAYKKSNNLWISILCHAGINTIFLITLLLV